jgi:MFS family permease
MTAPRPTGPRRTPFAALLISCVVSVTGTTMSAIAVPWLVLTTTGSATRMGVVGFAQMAAYVTAQFLAGPVVDRMGLRRSFVVGNGIAALAVGAIPVLHAAGQLNFAVLVALVTVGGGVRGAADCANTALVPATAEVGGIALERAAGLNTSANRTAQLLGMSLAGVVVTVAGPASAIAVDAASFGVAALLVAVWVRLPEKSEAVAGTAESGFAAEPAAESAAESTGSVLRRYFRDLGAGLAFVRADRLLLGIIAMVGVTNLLDQGLSEVITPVWVKQEFGTPSALAVLGAVGGGAALAGNLLGSWLGPKLPRHGVYSVGFLVGGAPRFLILAAATTLPPVVSVVVVSEVFAGSLNSVLGATAMERIPEHLRARVLGVVRASAWIGIPFGALIAGYVVAGVGVGPAAVAFGLVYLVTTLAPFVFPVWRQMRRPEPDDVRAPESAALSTSA